jgi:hypothetical protein
VAEPAIAAQPPAVDTEFVYTARVEVKPAFELPELTGLPARRPKPAVTGLDVERELEALRQRQAALLEEPPEMAASPGHTLTIDFVGRSRASLRGGGQGGFIRLAALCRVRSGSGAARRGSRVRVRFPDDYATRELLAGTRLRPAATGARVAPTSSSPDLRDLSRRGPAGAGPH